MPTIREDVYYAVAMNEYIDTVWSTPQGRATMPPAAAYSKPVILPRWEQL